MEATSLILVTEPQIRATLRDELRAALADLLPAAVRRATAKPYLTKAELMELTGWSSRQVEYKKAQREIEYVKRGRTVLFPTEAVHRYLDGAAVPVRRAA